MTIFLLSRRQYLTFLHKAWTSKIHPSSAFQRSFHNKSIFCISRKAQVKLKTMLKTVFSYDNSSQKLCASTFSSVQIQSKTDVRSLNFLLCFSQFRICRKSSKLSKIITFREIIVEQNSFQENKGNFHGFQPLL